MVITTKEDERQEGKIFCGTCEHQGRDVQETVRYVKFQLRSLCSKGFANFYGAMVDKCKLVRFFLFSMMPHACAMDLLSCEEVECEVAF